MILGKLYGLQPKFTVSSLATDMDVDRFVAIEAVEEKPEGSRDVLDSGHSPTSSFRAALPKASGVYVSLAPPSSHETLCLEQRPNTDGYKADSRHVLQSCLAHVLRHDRACGDADGGSNYESRGGAEEDRQFAGVFVSGEQHRRELGLVTEFGDEDGSEDG